MSMSVELPPFPVDDSALSMVYSALHPAPPAERSSLNEVLQLYSELGGSDIHAVAEEVDDYMRVMRDPQYSTHCLVDALIAEIRRLRTA